MKPRRSGNVLTRPGRGLLRARFRTARVMDILVLTRFLDVPAGRGRPCGGGAAVESALKSLGWSAGSADPLDECVPAPGGGARTAGLVLAALCPFNPAYDLPAIRGHSMRGAAVLNRIEALERFADPARPLQALWEAGAAVRPWILMRKPQEDGARGIGFPAVVEVFAGVLPGRRIEAGDAGSLDGILDLVWRKDAAALVRGGLSLAESTSCRVQVAGGRAVGPCGVAAAAAAERAAGALGLDFAAFDLSRGRDGYEVVSVLPFAFEGPDDARPEIAEAVARHADAAARAAAAE